MAEDPADSNAAGVLDDEDHKQHQRSRQKRCREVEGGLATVAPGARLTGFSNLGHGGRLPRLPPSKRIVGPDDSRSLLTSSPARVSTRLQDLPEWAGEGEGQ